jgi:Zn-dependent protease with chaperone function
LIVLFPLAAAILAALLAGTLNWLALIPWRRSRGAHWTERARELYPARAAATQSIWLIPANAFLLAMLLHPADRFLAPATGFLAWIGALLGTWQFDKEVVPGPSFRTWLHLAFVGAGLRLAGWFVLIGAVVAMPDTFGWVTAAMTTVVVLVFLWLLWGGGLRVLRWLRLLVPADARLQGIVSDTAGRMGIKVCAVWILEFPTSSAAALPPTRELLFSRRLLELHPDHEIAAICAHELGHLTESKLVLAGRILISCALLPWIWIKPTVHTFGVSGLAAIALLTGLSIMLGRRLGRRMETRADRLAAEHQNEDGTYAQALARLYEANQMPAVMPGKRKIHPHLYDRLLAAGVTPDYPRPEAPMVIGWTADLLMIFLGILVVLNVTAMLGF